MNGGNGDSTATVPPSTSGLMPSTYANAFVVSREELEGPVVLSPQYR